MNKILKNLFGSVIVLALLAVLAAIISPVARAFLSPVYSAGTAHAIASTGTFTANGASSVTVTDANIAVGSQVLITLNTVSGTVGAIPHLATITAGTSFTVVGTASDTSVYTYWILN